jgi:hypothetical protein
VSTFDGIPIQRLVSPLIPAGEATVIRFDEPRAGYRIISQRPLTDSEVVNVLADFDAQHGATPTPPQERP